MIPANARKLYLLLFFLSLFLGRWLTLPKVDISENTLVTIRFKITNQPYLKGSYQIIEGNRVSIKTSPFPGYFYGQKIQVTGKFTKRVINKFLTKYEGSFPKIVLIEDKPRVSLIAFLLSLRVTIEDKVKSLLPSQSAGLLLGMTFGTKTEISQNFLQKLRKTGTIHLVVASGQNLSLLAWALSEGLLLVMRRKWAVLASSFLVIGYVLLTGAEAPVVRAGVMVLAAYAAQFFGRLANIKSAFLFAGAMLLVLSPLILFDLGFQLSFCAMAGLIWIYPILRLAIPKVVRAEVALSLNESSNACLAGRQASAPPAAGYAPLSGASEDIVSRQRSPHGQQLKIKKFVFGFSEYFLVSLSAWLATLPVIFFNFRQINIFAPLINGFVLWLVAPIMVLGFATGLLALIFKPLAMVVSWFAFVLTEVFIRLIDVFAKLG